MIQQTCLPAISKMKDFENFLKSNLEYCILMDFHISLLEDMVKMAHENSKKVFVHLDLIKGDEAGCEYVCQRMRVDGVISTKVKVIETAKKNKKIAIQRMFLIDSKSLMKSLKQVSESNADYIEVLPGIAYSILPFIKEQVSVPLISGGLIKSVEDVENCLKHGASHVSVSSLDVIKKYI